MKEKIESEEDLKIPAIEIKSESDLYNLIFQEDDITWQAVIYELARSGKVDPWDIDVSVLAQEFLATIKKLKDMNFRLSGKVILAAAILLKLKSERLGLEQLLMLTNPEKFPDDVEPDDDLFDIEAEKHFTKAKLDLRIPGVRKRNVTVFELVEALKRAVETDERRRIRAMAPREYIRPLPEVTKVDIFAKIEAVFSKLKELVGRFKKKTVEFEDIVPSKEKKDIIWTLIPLLHLANQDKIVLRQDEPFGKIYVDIKEAELAKGLKREEITEQVELKEENKDERKSRRTKEKT